MKIGDVVIFKDQSKNHIKKCLSGGIVKDIKDTYIVLWQHSQGLRVYRAEELRALTPEDITEDGIEIF